MAKKVYQYTGPSGEKFQMLPVDIDKSEEYWNKYFLADGTILKVKVVVVKAGKSADKPVPGSGGQPLYHIQSQTVVVAEIPDDQLLEEENAR
jgi:hypothetical protein